MAVNTSASGRRAPDGGIMPARSLRIIFSATSPCWSIVRRVETGQRQATGLAALAVAPGAVLLDERGLLRRQHRRHGRRM